MTAELIPATAIWRNGRTQAGNAQADRVLSVDAALTALERGTDKVYVAPGDVDAVRAWTRERVTLASEVARCGRE